MSGKRVALAASVLAMLLVATLVGRHHLATTATPLPVDNRLGGDFTLSANTGEPFTLHQLRGEVVLLSFGFASCADVCPLTLMRLHEVIMALGQQSANLHVVFVSIDPMHDRPSELSAYVHVYDPAILGVTGTPAQVAKTAALYGVVYPQTMDDKGRVNFLHSSYIYLLDQQGRVRRVYPQDTTSHAMARDIRRLLVSSNS